LIIAHAVGQGGHEKEVAGNFRSDRKRNIQEVVKNITIGVPGILAENA